MEEDFYHSDFEDLIRNKAEQYKMYPSDKVWKNIDRSLRSRRRWYWTGFVLLLTGVSYFAVTELMTPFQPRPALASVPEEQNTEQVAPGKLVPFTSNLREFLPPQPAAPNTVTSDFVVEDSGSITASFEIPMRYLPGNDQDQSGSRAAFLISGLEPIDPNEQYQIELSWPIDDLTATSSPAETLGDFRKVPLHPVRLTENSPEHLFWLQEQISLKDEQPKKRISWQLAFSPTINYRKLNGESNVKTLSRSQTIPMATNISGDPDRLVNHTPALGFELGSHAILHLGNRVRLKGGLQFNYAKYDIAAFRAPAEQTTIALNSQLGGTGGSLVSFSDLRNFGGDRVETIANQYYQLSVPLGFEVRIFGNQQLQFNIASTIQPTYLINGNTYLITTDYKNYTKAPSLVRKWNLNAAAEAFISYTKGNVKWQVGPQFRHQLLSSYQNAYPIREYLMEYGIKVGITKTIR